MNFFRYTLDHVYFIMPIKNHAYFFKSSLAIFILDIQKISKEWIERSDVEVIISTGGTGLSPRDLTIDVLQGVFDSKLTGVEQALHSYGRGKVKTAMLSRLIAGTFKRSIIICLPGSPGAVKDALSVLIPTIFHSFHMIKGEQH